MANSLPDLFTSVLNSIVIELQEIDKQASFFHELRHCPKLELFTMAAIKIGENLLKNDGFCFENHYKKIADSFNKFLRENNEVVNQLSESDVSPFSFI